MPGGRQDLIGDARIWAGGAMWTDEGKLSHRRFSGHIATASAAVVSQSGVGVKESRPPTRERAMSYHSGFSSPSMWTRTRVPRSANMPPSSS